MVAFRDKWLIYRPLNTDLRVIVCQSSFGAAVVVASTLIDKVLNNENIRAKTVMVLRQLGAHLGRPYNPPPPGTWNEQQIANQVEKESMQAWFQNYFHAANFTNLAADSSVTSLYSRGQRTTSLNGLVVFGVSGKVEIASIESFLNQANKPTDPKTISHLINDISGLSYKKLNLAISELPRFQ